MIGWLIDTGSNWNIRQRHPSYEVPASPGGLAGHESLQRSGGTPIRQDFALSATGDRTWTPAYPQLQMHSPHIPSLQPDMASVSAYGLRPVHNRSGSASGIGTGNMITPYVQQHPGLPNIYGFAPVSSSSWQVNGGRIPLSTPSSQGAQSLPQILNAPTVRAGTDEKLYESKCRLKLSN